MIRRSVSSSLVYELVAAMLILLLLLLLYEFLTHPRFCRCWWHLISFCMTDVLAAGVALGHAGEWEGMREYLKSSYRASELGQVRWFDY